MASSPITSQQIDGETMETVTDFILWGSKITTDGDCSHEIKRNLLLGRKTMTNLAAKLLQSCLTLQPHGLYNPWNSPGQNTGLGSLSLLRGSSQPRD